MPARITRLKAWVVTWAREFPSSITLNIDLGFCQLFLMVRIKRMFMRRKIEQHNK